MQHGVGQLEQMFTKGKADLKVLRQLEHELQYRQVPRAVALLAEVETAMNGRAPATHPVAEPPLPPTKVPASAPKQPSLWEAQPSSAHPATVPSVAQLRPTAHMVMPPVANPQSPPTMLIEDACKVLKTTLWATWESIEQTRRLLVQRSHPSLLRPLSDERRAQVLAEARRVNAAYATLQMARCYRT
jgi:hypothetical protein